MHADSMAIRRTTPEYPIREMVATMKLDSMLIIFAIMFLGLCTLVFGGPTCLLLPSAPAVVLSI